MEDIRSYLNSDPDDTFSELYNTYRVKLQRVARYYLNYGMLAEDVVADVFTKLWGKRFCLKEIKDIKSYLFIMVKRRCLDEINKSSYKNHQELGKLSPHVFINYKDPEVAYLNQELAEKIKFSLEKLPDKCRIVFLLVKEDQLKYKEVAELLNISEKTVEMHVGNALKALRKDLETYVFPHKKPKNQPLDRMIMFMVSFI